MVDPSRDMKPTVSICVPYKTALAVQLIGPFGTMMPQEIATWVKDCYPEFSYNGKIYVYNKLYATTKVLLNDVLGTTVVTSVIAAYFSSDVVNNDDVEMACDGVADYIRAAGGRV
jgi:hypothetical protein